MRWYTRRVSAEMSLKSYRDRVDRRLEQVLPDPQTEPKRLHEAMRYMALAPGKRIRPALCFAAAEAVGGKADLALDPACSAELVHCFSLIHDDLPALDNDDLRRGRPTCHKVFGEALAILAGDGLFALAFEILAASPLPERARAACVGRLARASGLLVRGEVMDIEAEGESLTTEAIQAVHDNKTAALFSASCAMGAIAGGANSEEIERLAEFGALLGAAFQIADDVLNETSTQEELGKAVGSDRDRRKATYVALLGLEGARAAAESRVQEAVSHLRGLPGDIGVLEELAEFSFARRN